MSSWILLRFFFFTCLLSTILNIFWKVGLLLGYRIRICTDMMVFRYILLPEYVKYSNSFPDRVDSDKLIGYVLIRNLFPFFFLRSISTNRMFWNVIKVIEKCERRRFVVDKNLFLFIRDKKCYNLIKNVELWKWIRDWIKAMVSTVLSLQIFGKEGSESTSSFRNPFVIGRCN